MKAEDSRISSTLPNWSVNDTHLFTAIEFALKSGIQLSASTDSLISSRIKPVGTAMILGKLNELITGNKINGRQLSSRLNHIRQDHEIMTETLNLSGWGYDVDTGVSTTTELGKATYVKAHPEAAKFMHKLMPGFDVLNSMWMGTHVLIRNPANAIRCYKCTDGVRTHPHTIQNLEPRHEFLHKLRCLKVSRNICCFPKFCSR